MVQLILLLLLQSFLPLYSELHVGRGAGIIVGNSATLESTIPLDLTDGFLYSIGSATIGSGLVVDGVNITAYNDATITYANGSNVVINGANFGGISLESHDSTNIELTITGSGSLESALSIPFIDPVGQLSTPSSTLIIGFDGPVQGISLSNSGTSNGTYYGSAIIELSRDLHFMYGSSFSVQDANDTIFIYGGNNGLYFSGVGIDTPLIFSSGNVSFEGDCSLNALLTFEGSGQRIIGNGHTLTLFSGAGLATGDGSDITLSNLVVATDGNFTNFLAANTSTPDETTIFYNVTVDDVWFDNVQFDNATGGATVGSSALTMSVADASRRATIKLLDDLALTGVWTVANNMIFDLNGHTLDLTGVNNALTFPSGVATVTIKNGTVVLDAASFLFDTTQGNSQIDAYNVTFQATQDDSNFLTDARLNIRSDCFLQLADTGDGTGSILVIDATDTHEGSILLWNANLWYDTMGLVAAGSLTPNSVAAYDEGDPDIARLRSGGVASVGRYLERVSETYSSQQQQTPLTHPFLGAISAKREDSLATPNLPIFSPPSIPYIPLSFVTNSPRSNLKRRREEGGRKNISLEMVVITPSYLKMC